MRVDNKASAFDLTDELCDHPQRRVEFAMDWAGQGATGRDALLSFAAVMGFGGSLVFSPSRNRRSGSRWGSRQRDARQLDRILADRDHPRLMTPSGFEGTTR